MPVYLIAGLIMIVVGLVGLLTWGWPAIVLLIKVAVPGAVMLAGLGLAYYGWLEYVRQKSDAISVKAE